MKDTHICDLEAWFLAPPCCMDWGMGGVLLALVASGRCWEEHSGEVARASLLQAEADPDARLT
eukprot:4793850-Amphidinium_carterae.2